MISFYGAINMAADPLSKMEEMSAEALQSYRYFFVSGNRDLYKFGIPAIRLDRLLRDSQADHFFALGEGGHDSTFYLPYLIPAFSYMVN